MPDGLTPPDPQEVARIAEGLTEPMRYALLNAGPLRHGWKRLYVHWSVRNPVAAGLKRRKCVENGRALSELGLAVRDHLRKQP